MADRRLSADDGPVLPLYLNLAETETLQLAVLLLKALSANMTDPEAMAKAGRFFGDKGPGFVSRLDQTLAAVSQRLPIVNSLSTALAELGYSLERTET